MLRLLSVGVRAAEEGEQVSDEDQADKRAKFNESILSSVNDALNRAGIYCAVTFAEGIDMIAKERDALKAAIVRGVPIRMRLVCEACGELHVDAGEFATKPHHTHQCERCGLTWRPAIENTVGVRHLWEQSK